MHICVLTTTRGKLKELERLFKSLAAQTYSDFSILLGDQCAEGVLDSLIKEYSGLFPITRICLQPCSLSVARNLLLPHARGDLILFSDDDSYYSPNAFEQVALCNAQEPRAGAFVAKGFPEPGPVEERFIPLKKMSRFSVFSKSPSWCLFVRKEAVDETGGFDEQLGIGSPTPWQSGEETDLLVRVISSGYSVYKAASVHAFHDAESLITPDLSRIKAYGMGRMYLLRKHKFPVWFNLLNIVYPLMHIVHELPRLGWGAYRKRMAMFKGRLKGFFAVRN